MTAAREFLAGLSKRVATCLKRIDFVEEPFGEMAPPVKPPIDGASELAVALR